ncbi:hypothetical protein C4K23_1469 [Pseudomonas chlororaphis]|nr:hypothetical protein C4K23_1469 [Pseudomonas chlororaphis]
MRATLQHGRARHLHDRFNRAWVEPNGISNSVTSALRQKELKTIKTHHLLQKNKYYPPNKKHPPPAKKTLPHRLYVFPPLLLPLVQTP